MQGLSDSGAFDAASVEALRVSFRGSIIRPDDEGYDIHRRIWNGAIDRRPAIIARCEGVSNVRTAVNFAREHGLLVAVRGGGHSFPGHSTCDGGMLIDLAPMNGIRVDPANASVRAQAGALIGDLDHETQEFGYAVPAGIVTHTGIAGLTLGGGIGWIMRKFGLTIDNLLSVDIVTADGGFVTASEDDHADLFWGIRGGGGNFGIVTEFEYRMHRIGTRVTAGPVFWPMKDTKKVLRFYRDWIADCPDELMTIIVQRKAPPVSFVPPSLVGERVVGVVACYVGSSEEAERCLQPLKSFGTPVVDACVSKPWLEHQASFDPAFVPGRWYYVKSCDVDVLNDDIIDIAEDFGMRIESPISSIALWQMGGAVARIGEQETAFQGRSAGHSFNINGNSMTAEGFDVEREWARAYYAALAPYHTSVYVNFLMEEGEDRIRTAYPGEKWERLRQLKRRYDPGNLFRLNQNIPPE